MKSLSQNLLFTFLLSILACVPVVESNKNELKFKKKEPRRVRVTPLPLEASYESLKEHLIVTSCFGCHSQNQDFLPVFNTKEDLIKYGPDILFYATEGCEAGLCMPPRDDQGRPVRPIPTDKTIELFKEWLTKQGDPDANH